MNEMKGDKHIRFPRKLEDQINRWRFEQQLKERTSISFAEAVRRLCQLGLQKASR